MSEHGSIEAEDEEMTANEFGGDDERVEKKSEIFPAFSQLKLYKPSQDIDENHHNDNDTDSDYEDEDVDNEEESEEEDEDDPNELCRKLHHICDSLHVPAQSLCAIIKLISKLRSCDYIE